MFSRRHRHTRRGEPAFAWPKAWLGALASLSILVAGGSTSFAAPELDSLSPEEITAFGNRLQSAHAEQAVLSQRLTCLGQEDARLAQMRDVQQQRLAEQLRHGRELADALPALDADLAARRAAYKREQAQLDAKTETLRQMRGERQAIEDWANSCTWPAFCRLFSRLASLTGRIKDYEGQLPSAEADVRSADEAAALASAEATAAYQTSRDHDAETEATQRQVKEAETAIKGLAAILSALRDQTGAQERLLAEYADAVLEASRVNPQRARRRTVLDVRDLSQQLDAHKAATAQTLSQARAALAGHGLTGCLA